MEIVRNGQKILLTEWELFQAYEEQKYLYLKESVLENMEDCLPKEMYSVDQHIIICHFQKNK